VYELKKRLYDWASGTSGMRENTEKACRKKDKRNETVKNGNKQYLFGNEMDVWVIDRWCGEGEGKTLLYR
jgi:hypothetical protein